MATSARTTSGRSPRRWRRGSTTWSRPAPPWAWTSAPARSWPPAAARKGVETRRPAQRVHPRALLAASPRTPSARTTSRYYRDGDELVIYGTATERFANMFNAEVRRPMADGLINPREKPAMPVLEAILQTHGPARARRRARSWPSRCRRRPPARTRSSRTTRPRCAGTSSRMGYKAVAINEGLAVVFAELEDHNFTGIGISCGGGMCNGTLAYLSIPSIMFSIAKGGDFIDSSAGAVLNEHADAREGAEGRGPRPVPAGQGQVREGDPHLLRGPGGDAGGGAAPRHHQRREAAPTDRPLPIVLSGGTAKPKGFKELFERTLADALAADRDRRASAWPPIR